MKRALLEQLVTGRAQAHAQVLVTRLDTGEQTLLTRGAPPQGLSPSLRETGWQLAERDLCALVPDDGGELFFQVLARPRRMIVVGAVHAAQFLATIARLHAFDVHVIDPREAFASPERFPDVTLHHAWPDEVLPALGIDRRSAVVTLAHDPRLDEPGLLCALRAGAFYVGALGSRRTHRARLERLAASGLATAELARIHAPVGLDIGAVTPAEIATAVMAQVIAALRGGAS